jgi:hypothetical protein
LAELYRAVRLYVNFFQPSLKLRTKRRTGAHVQRTYGPARTPFQQVLATDVLPPDRRGRLDAIYAALDPVRLLRQIETLQDALWRHAVFGRASSPASGTPPGPSTAVPFDARACGLAGAPAAETVVAMPRGPKQRKTRKPLGPRTWRTRVDPFADVWDEVAVWLTARPERTARSVFEELRARAPDRYPPGQLRTLQRRVRDWRASVVLAFDARWLSEDLLAGHVTPEPLRALVATAGGARG